VKTLLLAAALIGVMACGETAPATTTQSEATPSASFAATPAPTATPPVAAQTVVTFVNAPITAARGLAAPLQVRTAANTPCSIEVDYKSGPSKAAGLDPGRSQWGQHPPLSRSGPADRDRCRGRQTCRADIIFVVLAKLKAMIAESQQAAEAPKQAARIRRDSAA
jgi:hypothetical protein